MYGYNNKGRWVNTHKLEDCYWSKKKSDEEPGKDTEEVKEGIIALEIL